MSRREVNLIGGFYKDASLPWSSQDTVNWLPVPAQAGGTRSEMKLRGAPGLRALVRNANDLIGPAVWIYGPVNSAGGVSGDRHFYYSAPTVQALTASAPVSIPDAMKTIQNPVSRISVANNVIFLHGTDSPRVNAQVSVNGGLNWEACDSPLETVDVPSGDVFWNGRFFYHGKQRSSNGVEWTAIPNFPFAESPSHWIARSSDGAFVVSSNIRRDVYVTLDDGATWLTRNNPFGVIFGLAGVTRPYATDGVTLVSSAQDGIGYGWSDDLLATPATGVNGPGTYIKVSGGIWLGARSTGVDAGLRRSLNGKAWTTVDTVNSSQEIFLPSIATDGGTWAFIKYISPGVFRLRLSSDGAQTWADSVTLPASGSIIYRGQP